MLKSALYCDWRQQVGSSVRTDTKCREWRRHGGSWCHARSGFLVAVRNAAAEHSPLITQKKRAGNAGFSSSSPYNSFSWPWAVGKKVPADRGIYFFFLNDPSLLQFKGLKVGGGSPWIVSQARQTCKDLCRQIAAGWRGHGLSRSVNATWTICPVLSGATRAWNTELPLSMTGGPCRRLHAPAWGRATDFEIFEISGS